MNQDVGKLVLRLTLGVLILLHGIAKLKGGVGGIEGMLSNAGLPGILAYGVYIGEVLAPILIIIGFLTRPAALIIAGNMVVAIYLAHRAQLLTLNEQTGGWALELQGMFFFTALAIAFLGAGRLAFGGSSRLN